MKMQAGLRMMIGLVGGVSLAFGQVEKENPLAESREVLAEMVAGKHGGAQDMMVDKAGVRAFIILALLGNDTVETSPHAAAILLLLGELRQQEDARHYYGGMYDQAYVTLALARLAKEEGGEDLKTQLQGAVDLLVASQNEIGGWRYSPESKDVDSSVVASVLLALGEARLAGAKVPEAVFVNGGECLLNMQGGDGSFGYTPAAGKGNVCRSAMAARALVPVAGSEKNREKALGYLASEWEALGPYRAFAAWHLSCSTDDLDAELGAELRTAILKTRNELGYWEEQRSRLLPTALYILALEELER